MITIEDLHVIFQTDGGKVHAVDGISIHVEPGEFYTLLGPSGCGKSTTLRCLAGLEHPTSGRILLDGAVVYDSNQGIAVPPHQRDIAMVFQSYAIWPHLTVFENVAFPLREMRPRVADKEIWERVTRALELVQLSGYEQRPAPFLSGGQQQRLALARAICRESPVVLLDEPLSNLDAKLRVETRLELRSLVKRLNMTAVYVTHDQTEALTMADRVAVMNAGKVVQETPPREIYQKPQSRFVASFIGQINFLDGKITAPGTVDTPAGKLKFSGNKDHAVGTEVTVAIRPENLRSADEVNATFGSLIEGKVEEVVFLGNTLDCVISVGSAKISVQLHPSNSISPDDILKVRVRPEDITILAE
ncbi:MAG: ABC transporter ATP-binding protein [Pseudomonadota bacterium]